MRASSRRHSRSISPVHFPLPILYLLVLRMVDLEASQLPVRGVRSNMNPIAVVGHVFGARKNSGRTKFGTQISIMC